MTSPGQPVPTAHPDHQPVVPPWAGRPWCTCGYVGGDGTDRPLLADHLREFDPDYGRSSGSGQGSSWAASRSSR